MQQRFRLLALVAASALALASTASAQEFNILETSVGELHKAFDDGSATCEGVVKAYLDRINALEDGGIQLNAITYVNPKALEVARELDKVQVSGAQKGPLHCVPIVLKDNVDTFDMPTSNGSIILKNSIPKKDGYITEKIRRAGAVIIGKSSMGEFAGGSYNTIDGPIKNPFNSLRAPSGSSGGSAVAVTSNLTVLAVGTDTSTSVRGPAAMAGIVGMRPTTGLWSRSGIAPKNLTFDTAGPMARTVTDAAILLGVAAGRDETDPQSVAVYDAHPSANGALAGEIDYTTFLEADALNGARIGVVRNFFGGDPEIDKLAEQAIEVIRAQGAEVVDITVDPTFVDFYVNKSTPNIRDYVDYAFRENFEKYLATLGDDVPKTVAEFVDLYEKEVNLSDKPAEASVMRLLKTSLTTNSNDPKYAEMLNQILPAATEFKRKLFEENRLDAMIYPSNTAFASRINTPVKKTDDPTFVAAAHPWESPHVFAGYSSVGNPDVTVPMGFGSQGMPITLSFMGKPYEEGRILGFAFAYEQASKHRRSPDL